MTESSDPLEVALEWAGWGVGAFPVLLSPESSGTKIRKRPATSNGHHDATTDRGRLEAMFRNAARRQSSDVVVGVGLVPGSAGYVVVDCDGAEACDHATGIGLNGTWTSETARGPGHEHRWFKAPEGMEVGNARPEGWIRSMDIRGSAGWVVAPGTETPWGSWVPREPFDPVKVRSIGEESLRAPRASSALPDAAPGESSGLAEDKLLSLARQVAEAPEGTRNDTLNTVAFTVGGWVGNMDLDPQVALTALVRAAEECGVFDDDERDPATEIERMILDGARRPTAPTGSGGVVLEGLEEEIERLKREREYADVLRRFPLTDLRWVVGPDAPERSWLVEGFIGVGTSNALVAPAGVGKSLIALRLAMDVCRGHKFVGQWVRQARVLYIDLENTLVDLSERLMSLGMTEENAGDYSDLYHLSLPPFMPFDTADGARELAVVIEAYGLLPGDLVILDSTQRLVKGEEDKSDTWRAFYQHVGLLLKRQGLTVLRLDNTGKDVERAARGSSSKSDDVDAIWLGTRTEVGGVRLKNLKSRMLGGLKELELTYHEDEDGRVTHGRIATEETSDELEISLALELIHQAEIPEGTGHHKVFEALKDHPKRPSRKIVRKAVQRRNARAGARAAVVSAGPGSARVGPEGGE